ncbi:MAG: hypothetical protein RMK45_07015 [Armatimonadota bacterium]|nr:hypothetical protein [Armatimonadota bacterium]
MNYASCVAEAGYPTPQQKPQKKEDLKRQEVWIYPDEPLPAELYFRNGRWVRWVFY